MPTDAPTQSSETEPAIPEAVRTAKLIANGDMSLPIDLAPGELTHLAGLVRELRTTQLIRFLARQVAQDIAHFPRD